MKQLQSFRIPYQKDPNLNLLVAGHLGVDAKDISNIRILKRSLDARKRNHFYWVYSLEVYLQGESPKNLEEPFPLLKWTGPPPLIIGAGPAGLFAAWTLLEHGIRPILLERGMRTYDRMRKISLYWRQGLLDENSNVCNGEGGAGTFSDGKLITRIKSPYISQVMRAFVNYGAPPEITYAYNPHVGSNLIREVIRKMSDDLMAKGGDLRFSTRVERLHIKNKKVEGLYLANGECIEGTGLILACGHSAGRFFETLKNDGVQFEPKSFALGLRIEHPQGYINEWQYGKTPLENLDPAQYKLTHHWAREEVGVYTFCMCPGGYVISSTTDPGTVVVNGMSNYHRNSPWANAAVVCSIDHEKIPGENPFKVMHFQRGIEKKMYEASQVEGPSHAIPAQHLEDFLEGRKASITVKSSCPSGVIASDLSKLLPPEIYNYLCQGLLGFDKKRKGFNHPKALLHAVESRTSSPVRIPRHSETMESVSTEGLFPCGEGPGYAGGITSAAVDGINAALAWIQKFT
ncbi:MAG TPA: hypothetical protein DDW49_06170 [Deltaproteobacteria bacterium]|nr:MAG: hypothetical protein A2048_02160 [Deltaproteobacteria bacterium GWA2_45_12]HBF12959.1 hypothetical protein [Deltaproteobacteria bacterium]